MFAYLIGCAVIFGLDAALAFTRLVLGVDSTNDRIKYGITLIGAVGMCALAIYHATQL